MRVEREKAERVKNERAAHERAVSLVFGPPALCTSAISENGACVESLTMPSGFNTSERAWLGCL